MKSLNRSFLLVNGLLISLLFAGTQIAQGQQETIERWTLAQSPIPIKGKTLIPKEKTVIIDPGVVVAFEPQATLEVYGTLLAIGREDNRIIFTSTKDAEFADKLYDDITNVPPFERFKYEWDKIAFLSDQVTSPSILNNVLLIYCRVGLSVENAYPMLQNVSFERTLAERISINSRWQPIARTPNSFSARLLTLSCSIQIVDSLTYYNKKFVIKFTVTNNGNEPVIGVKPYFIHSFPQTYLEMQPPESVVDSPILAGETKELVLAGMLHGNILESYNLITYAIGMQQQSGLYVGSNEATSNTREFRVLTSRELPAPSELKIISQDRNSIRLGWEYPHTFETGFELELRKGNSPWQKVAGLAADVLTYSLPSSPSVEAMQVRICALSEGSKSPYSNILDLSTLETTPSFMAQPKKIYKKWWFVPLVSAGTSGLGYAIYQKFKKDSDPASEPPILPAPPDLP